jgi:hypothetical protein
MHKITIDFDEISVTDNFAIEIFILWRVLAGSIERLCSRVPVRWWRPGWPVWGDGAGLRHRSGGGSTHVIAKGRWGDREFYLTGREIFPGKNLNEIFWEILRS